MGLGRLGRLGALAGVPALLFGLGTSACGSDPASPQDPAGSTTTDVGTTGVGSDEGDSSGEPAVPPPTWHQDIAPIVVAKCAGCHDEGGIGPFPLSTFEWAGPLAPAIAATTHARTMPPFAADETDECEMRFGWKDDLRLTDDELALLQAWADGGAPEGDPATASPIADPPAVTLPDADLHLTQASAVTIGGNQDKFLCFSLDPGLTEDRYLTAMQIVPGNPEIVHHVLVYVDDDASSAEAAGPDGYYECSGGAAQGDLIGAWAPGMVPTRTPPDVGMLVPAGARLVMNVHYHPTGGPDQIDDSTGIDLEWLDSTPVWAAELFLFGNGQSLLPGPNDDGGAPDFVIPAGVTDHTEAMLVTLPASIPEIRLWEIGAHMHYLGVDMIIGVLRESSPGPTEECLLHAPRYNFEWQRLYAYDVDFEDAPRLAGGDKVYMRCTYDNSLGNPGVVEALGQQGLSEPVEVRLGEETLDEMCLGVYGVAYPNLF